MAADTLDQLATLVTAGDLTHAWNQQADTEKALEARARAFLERTDITPLQRQQGEKNLRQLLGSRVDIAEGNGKLFVDTAKESGQAYVNGVTNLVVGVVPVWLRAVLIGAALVYVVFVFSPFLRAKGIIK